MRAPNVQHRGYEGDRESHRLCCTYVHYSSKIFLVRARKAKGTPPARAPALLASASQPSPPGHGGWRSYRLQVDAEEALKFLSTERGRRPCALPSSGSAAALTLLASSLRAAHIYQITLYPVESPTLPYFLPTFLLAAARYLRYIDILPSLKSGDSRLCQKEVHVLGPRSAISSPCPIPCSGACHVPRPLEPQEPAD